MTCTRTTFFYDLELSTNQKFFKDIIKIIFIRKSKEIMNT